MTRYWHGPAAEGQRTAERVVVADRHPATVARPDGSIVEKARVVLTRDELYVYVADAGTVRELARQPYAADGSTIGRGAWTVLAGDGPWLVERGAGCGCSSPLKRFVPWTPWRVGRP